MVYYVVHSSTCAKRCAPVVGVRGPVLCLLCSAVHSSVTLPLRPQSESNCSLKSHIDLEVVEYNKRTRHSRHAYGFISHLRLGAGGPGARGDVPRRLSCISTAVRLLACYLMANGLSCVKGCFFSLSLSLSSRSRALLALCSRVDSLHHTYHRRRCCRCLRYSTRIASRFGGAFPFSTDDYVWMTAVAVILCRVGGESGRTLVTRGDRSLVRDSVIHSCLPGPG